MAIGRTNTSGGGGYSLNFDVVNFNSDEGTKQPTDPKENTIWIDTSWVQNGWSFGADMPLRRTKSTNKNFVVYPYYETTHTEDGITFTDNGDGTITANGTATDDSAFRASYTSAESGMFLLNPGIYMMSGCPSGGSGSTYSLQINRLNNSGEWEYLASDYGNGRKIEIVEDTVCCVLFRVYAGTTVKDLNVYFQIEKGSSATSFKAGNANGQVWIKPSDASTISFEALKRNIKNNSIVLHPGEVYMYNASGGWNRQKNIKFYKNGAWTELNTAVYIYNKGNSTGYSLVCDEGMKQMSSGYTAVAGYVTVGSNSITVNTTGRSYDFANIFVTNSSGSFIKVDLSKCTKIRIKGTLSGATTNTDCVFRAMSEMGAICTESNVASKSFTAGTIDATVDVSSVNSSCYLGFTFFNSEQVVKVITFELTELWLE